MKIDTAKIKGYESMTDEEKVKALEGFDMVVDYSGFVSKETYDKAASEASDYKKKYKATLSEKERLELDEAEKRKNIESELEKLKKEKSLSEHTATYIGLGYDEELAKDTAKALVDGKLDKVFANQKKFNETHEASIKAELLKSTPKPEGAGGSNQTGMTKDKFKKLSLTEKQEFFDKDPESYKEFYKEE